MVSYVVQTFAASMPRLEAREYSSTAGHTVTTHPTWTRIHSPPTTSAAVARPEGERGGAGGTGMNGE